MKKILYILALAVAAMTGACTGDLDRMPLNQTDFTAEDAYADPTSYASSLAKVYGGFALVGMGGAGDSEISVTDAGASELVRAWWSLQEVSTDAVKAAWKNDTWVQELNTNTWSTTPNDAITAIYERTILIVSLANEFLRQTTDARLDARGHGDVKSTLRRYRAEARFVRAYCYWMLLDAFGNPPFVTEESPTGAFFPPQISRADLFAWIESELLELDASSDLPAARQNQWGQADKGAVQGLLARLYLNAAVYTGTPRWTDAKSAAAKAIGGGYELCPDYRHLFMADNSTNPNAKRELIWVINYDYQKTQSYGGTTAIINGSLTSEAADSPKPNGANDGWGGYHVDYSYVRKFGVSNPNYVASTYDCPDRRAIFHIKERTQEMEDMYSIFDGWACIKYSHFSSTGTTTSGVFASTDFPMMRLGEMYLIYAEATLRTAGSASSNDATALGYLNELRTRAGLVGNLTSYDLEYLIDERARELMWEAHRRTDLVRFGFYTGDSYLWPWKGGARNGRSIDTHYNLCPLLLEDVNMNANLTQNPGYTK